MHEPPLTPEWTLDRLGKPGTTASMEDFWTEKARWQLDRVWTLKNTGWEYGYTAGSRLVTHKGIWYLFHRKIYFNERCPGTNWLKLGTVGRRSTDQGHTWSEPVDVVVPTPGTPWSCMATDGDVYYNEQENTWHMLFQSLGDDHTWAGSHVVRVGDDPLGAFVETHPNPVIPRGLLWMQICEDDNDDCVKIPGSKMAVYDEGTYDIFQYDGEYYWVSFHGYDGIRGYRGIAKTKDFRAWVAGDPTQGVPGDAIIDRDDLTGWRENWNTDVSTPAAAAGPIGVGAGTILQENGTYYIMVEGADMNLGCTAGQNWDWGLFRSRDLTSTHWEQYPAGNPLFYSSKALEQNGQSPPCNIAYGQFFRDPSSKEIYFKVGRESSDPAYNGIYLYKLVPSTNILTNGDLWTADARGWSLLDSAASTLNVFRYPNLSTDGRNFLEFRNISASEGETQPQGFFQDVNVSALTGKSFTFGGQFAAESQAGSARIATQQFSESGKLLREDTVAVKLTDTYTLASGNGQLRPGAVRLRFIFSTPANGPIRADEMFINVIP
jgi:hypothetical protein